MAFGPDGSVTSRRDVVYNRELIRDHNNGRDRPFSTCTHVRVSPATITGYGDYGDKVVWKDLGSAEDIERVGNYAKTNLQEFISPSKFSFQENNNFEIINFLAEIDDTMAMFSVNFLKSLRNPTDGYLATTFGVMPFLNDLKSLYSTLNDIFSGSMADELRNGKRIQSVSPVKFRDPVGQHEFEGKLRFNGVITAPAPTSADLLAIALDEVGLHPDLKSVWDLIPFSFLIDYIYPVGDALEQLHPRGWWKPVLNYSGSYSLDLRCYFAVYSWGTVPFGYFDGTYYDRGVTSVEVPPTAPKLPRWKSPNFRQLFNALMIHKSIRRY